MAVVKQPTWATRGGSGVWKGQSGGAGPGVCVTIGSEELV